MSQNSAFLWIILVVPSALLKYWSIRLFISSSSARRKETQKVQNDGRIENNEKQTLTRKNTEQKSKFAEDSRNKSLDEAAILGSVVTKDAFRNEKKAAQLSKKSNSIYRG